MTLNDELQKREVEETQKSARTDLTFAYAHQQFADAKEAVPSARLGFRIVWQKCGLL
jgi:hypothetical protein